MKNGMGFKEVSSHLFFLKEIEMAIRALTLHNLLRYLRKKEEEHYAEDGQLILELRTDHSGCVKDGVTFDILEEWSNLEELNEKLKIIYGRTNRSS